jgi:hypothetical protein
MFRALLAHRQEALHKQSLPEFPHPETSPHLQPHTTVTNPAFV